MSIETISLGAVGLNDLTLPTGTFLYSGFLKILQVIQASQSFEIVAFALGW
jgi:hypothetical protein